MKKCLAFAAGLFLLAGCNQSKDASTASGSAENMNKKNVETTQMIYRAIETGDVSKMDSLMSKDVVDHEGNMGKDIVGLDSVKGYLGAMHNYMDNMKFEILHSATSPDGEYFYTTVRMTGKAKANPWGTPVGKEMDDTSVDVIKMKDGKATDHWGFMSMKSMMEMMPPAPGDKKMPPMADSLNKKI